MVSGRELAILRLGEPDKEVMKRALLTEDDLHKAVRQKTGNDNLLEIRHAILERDGKITVILIEPK